MNTYAIGDIHGRSEALKQVLKACKFDYEKDKLIMLGDIADGGYNTYEVVEELIKIKNRILILGNHDEWFINHIKTGWAEEIWIKQGGAKTLTSYGAKVKEADYITDDSIINTNGIRIPVTHQEFFNKAVFYHIEDNKLFIHGGYNPKKPIHKQEKNYILWDRSLIERIKNGLKTPYKKIFIGHTPTQKTHDTTKPVGINSGDTILWLLDTGAGGNGKLTIMNTETEEYWQSKEQKPATKTQIDLVEKAYVFAKQKHKGQKDDEGKDYFETHIEKVSELTQTLTNNQELIAVALLHDTIEDTKTTYEEIKKEFGLRIADLVNELTHEGKPDEYGYYFPRLKSPEAIMIKLLDRASNISRMSAWSKKRQEAYIKKTRFWKQGE